MTLAPHFRRASFGAVFWHSADGKFWERVPHPELSLVKSYATKHTKGGSRFIGVTTWLGKPGLPVVIVSERNKNGDWVDREDPF